MRKTFVRRSLLTAMYVVAVSAGFVHGTVINEIGREIFTQEEGEFFGSSPRISIGFNVPPARVSIHDAEGRITGVDPASPVSAIGIGVELARIPFSQMFSMNTSNDTEPNLNAQNPQTDWGAQIATRTAQTYRIRLVGLQDGVEELGLVAGGPDGPGKDPIFPLTEYLVLVSPGAERELTVHFDPIGKTVTLTRLVAPADLAMDVDIACRLGLITPKGVCRSLKAKAEAAAKAIQRGNTTAARGQLNAFLEKLKAQGGKHVQEPALTILREEAEVLLETLSEGASGAPG